MLRRFTFWLWVAVVLQLLTGAVHSVSLFITPSPANETERQLIDLMINYRQDFGAGIHRSMMEIFKAVSSCFSLLCLLGGLINLYLLRKNVAADIVKGLVGVQVLIFGICFGVMAMLTFVPPIVATAMVFIVLAITYLTIPSTADNA